MNTSAFSVRFPFLNTIRRHSNSAESLALPTAQEGDSIQTVLRRRKAVQHREDILITALKTQHLLP